MPTSANPEAAYLIGRAMLECAVDQVAATWPGEDDPKIGRACVVWGEIAWDDCECGQLVVAVNRQFPSNEFPFDAGSGVGTGVGAVSQQSRCGSPLWLIEYTVSVLRCAPIQDDAGNPPTCEALDEHARVSSIDSWAVRTGVACCLQSLAKDLQENGATAITDYLIREQPSTGPRGGCGGSDLNVTVGIRNCFCPPGS
jgi:hypothetical protein